MSTRPQDWLPLSERDPLPGDPMRIAQEASRLRDLGAAMRGQVTRLREIGADNAGTGLYAEKLREAANDLAAKLDKVVGRYEKTATALKDWAPELGRFQDLTLAARTKALAAEELRRTNNAVTAVLAPGQELTPAQDAAARDRQIALDEAATMLRQARDQMQDAVDDARSAGRTYRDKIRDAIDDDAKDGRWDNIKDFVDRNAGWIKEATKILSNIATILALTAIFIPGLNMIVLGLTLAVTISHVALALSGNGSWAAVALDVVALATFGVAVKVGRSLKATQSVTRAAGARAAEKAALAQTRGARIAAGRQASGSGARAAAARRSIRAAKAEARAARLQFRDAPLAKATMGERWAARGAKDGQYLADINATRARFPGDARVAAASANTDDLLRLGRRAWAAGLFTDGVDKVGEESGPGYDQFTGRFTAEAGTTW